MIAVCKSVSRALCGQPSPRTQLQLRLFLYRAEIKPHASVKLYTIALIYIVNSVFSINQTPKTPMVAPLPWSGVYVPWCFSPACL